MKHLLYFFLIVIFFAAPGFASDRLVEYPLEFRALCIQDDCYKNGWVVVSDQVGLEIKWRTTLCIDGDCYKNGWQTEYHRPFDWEPNQVTAICNDYYKPCNKGASIGEYDPDGYLYRRFDCLNRNNPHQPDYDCNKYGYKVLPGILTVCKEFDCLSKGANIYARKSHTAGSSTKIGEISCLSDGPGSCLKEGFRVQLEDTEYWKTYREYRLFVVP